MERGSRNVFSVFTLSPQSVSEFKVAAVKDENTETYSISRGESGSYKLVVSSLYLKYINISGMKFFRYKNISGKFIIPETSGRS